MACKIWLAKLAKSEIFYFVNNSYSLPVSRYQPVSPTILVYCPIQPHPPKSERTIIWNIWNNTMSLSYAVQNFIRSPLASDTKFPFCEGLDWIRKFSPFQYSISLGVKISSLGVNKRNFDFWLFKNTLILQVLSSSTCAIFLMLLHIQVLLVH